MPSPTSEHALRFGALLRGAIREFLGGRDAVATAVDCSVQSVDSWCCGRMRPSPIRLNRLVSLLRSHGAGEALLDELYREALQSHGLNPRWSHAHQAGKEKITLCILGSAAWRRELSTVHIVAQYLNEAGQAGIIRQCGANVEPVLSYLDALGEEDGIHNLVLCGTSIAPEGYEAFLERMARHGGRTVLMRTDCPQEIINSYEKAYSVNWYFEKMACKATKLLAQAGHRRIGTVHLAEHEERFSGYLRALSDLGIVPDPRLILRGGTLSGYRNIKTLNFIEILEDFILHTDMTAVFTPTEVLTLAVPMLLKSNPAISRVFSFCGLACPGWAGDGLNLPITYVAHPLEEIARTVTDILLERPRKSPHRCIDVSEFATRVDLARLGSIKALT